MTKNNNDDDDDYDDDFIFCLCLSKNESDLGGGREKVRRKENYEDKL